MLTAAPAKNIQDVIYYTVPQCSATVRTLAMREREKTWQMWKEPYANEWILIKAAKLLNAWIIYLGLTQQGLMFCTSPDGTITLNTCFPAHIIDFTFIKTPNKIIVVLLSLLLTFVRCASHFCILFMHDMPLHLPLFLFPTPCSPLSFTAHSQTPNLRDITTACIGFLNEAQQTLSTTQIASLLLPIYAI